MQVCLRNNYHPQIRKVLAPLMQPWKFSGIALARSFSSSLFFIYSPLIKKNAAQMVVQRWSTMVESKKSPDQCTVYWLRSSWIWNGKCMQEHTISIHTCIDPMGYEHVDFIPHFRQKKSHQPRATCGLEDPPRYSKMAPPESNPTDHHAHPTTPSTLRCRQKTRLFPRLDTLRSNGLTKRTGDSRADWCAPKTMAMLIVLKDKLTGVITHWS